MSCESAFHSRISTTITAGILYSTPSWSRVAYRFSIRARRLLSSCSNYSSVNAALSLAISPSRF